VAVLGALFALIVAIGFLGLIGAILATIFPKAAWAILLFVVVNVVLILVLRLFGLY
jgi:hypothetical protein